MPEEEKQDVTIRTMESDIKAEPMPALEIKPETVNQLATPIVAEGKGLSKKNALWVSGGVVVAIALGLLGYFVIYPWLLPSKVAAPIIEEKKEVAAPAPAVEVHKSLFVTPATATAKITLSDLGLLNVALGLQKEAANVLNAGSIKEVEILDAKGNQTHFSLYLSQFLPTLSPVKFTDWFENDFTTFLYYDANGVWPGYVAKIKSGANVNELKGEIAKLEKGDVTVFYITPSGVMGQFKEGKVNSYATRYAVGSQPGAAFNYGYAGNYLLISTSYNGLKAALPLLGL